MINVHFARNTIKITENIFSKYFQHTERQAFLWDHLNFLFYFFFSFNFHCSTVFVHFTWKKQFSGGFQFPISLCFTRILLRFSCVHISHQVHFSVCLLRCRRFIFHNSFRFLRHRKPNSNSQRKMCVYNSCHWYIRWSAIISTFSREMWR